MSDCTTNCKQPVRPVRRIQADTIQAAHPLHHFSHLGHIVSIILKHIQFTATCKRMSSGGSASVWLAPTITPKRISSILSHWDVSSGLQGLSITTFHLHYFTRAQWYRRSPRIQCDSCMYGHLSQPAWTSTLYVGLSGILGQNKRIIAVCVFCGTVPRLCEFRFVLPTRAERFAHAVLYQYYIN